MPKQTQTIIGTMLGVGGMANVDGQTDRWTHIGTDGKQDPYIWPCLRQQQQL